MTSRALVPAIALVMLMSTLSVHAADVDGRWAGQLDTPMGTVPITFSFKASGTMLTGSMLGMDGSEIPIADGKIDGDKISYTVNVDFGGMAFAIAYKGVVSPAEIKLEGLVFDMPFSLVVTKEK